jgi:hypothetical protein
MAQTQSTDYVANDPFPAATHEDALDRLTFIAQQQQEEVDRSIKLSTTNTMTSTEFTVGATDRANKVLAFDGSGELSVTQELGTYKGTDATVTTEAYVVRDIIKSTTAGQLNNVYICVADAVVGDLLTDTDHFELLVDAVSAATSATNAANSASAASTSESNAATSESNASTSETNASNAQTAAETAQSAAETAQSAAETAQTAAETALDTFDDRFLGAKASDPTVDNDGNALIDGALYFDTTNDIMKVYDLTNTQWRQLTLTSANQTNVNTVAGEISPTNNIATVAGVSGDISTLSAVTSDIQSLADIEDGTTATDAISNVGNNVSDVTTVAGQITPTNNIATVASVDADITTVAGQISPTNNIATVAGDSADIGTVAGLSADIQALADIEDGTTATNAISNVGNNITDVTTVASNLASVNSFADTYRIGSTDPTTSLDTGDLFYNTTSSALKVYTGSAWEQGVTAGSGFIPTTGGGLTGDLTFGDNDKAVFGAGSDLEIYHDGSNSYIAENGNGQLYIQATDLRFYNSASNIQYLQANDGAEVILYYNNSQKLATTNTGIDVTGTASATTFSGDLNGTINTATTATTQTAGDNTTKVATTAFVTTAVNNAEPFPSGTSMLFQQTAAPTGWTKQTTHDDKALRIVTGTVGTGGSSAFSTALGSGATVAGGTVSGDPGSNLSVSVSGNIANTTLSINQIPSHSHTLIKSNSGGTASTNQNRAQDNVVFANTGNAGGGGSHNHGHNLSGSLSGNITAGNLAVGASTAAINVNYVDFIIANKD